MRLSTSFQVDVMLGPSVYPWASLPNDTVVCDVGGSNGHASINLLKSFPQLKIVVQDLPGVVEQGQEVCAFVSSSTAPDIRPTVPTEAKPRYRSEGTSAVHSSRLL
jgi:hypothetical protein